MNLSEVCYEAACVISDSKRIRYSCNVVAELSQGTNFWRQYSTLMTAKDSDYLWSGDIARTANNLNWTHKDFRTFLLLMASEAFK